MPGAVSVPGTFNSEIGCAGDWATDCAQDQLTQRADGMWSVTLSLPAGSYTYKVAINKSWTENYGQNGAAGGADIPLVVPTGGKAVTFLYDPVTHEIADNATSRTVTAAGTFQSEIGCATDWAADCLVPRLQDSDGDGIYTWTASTIPAGTWEVKAAINQGWTENYGQNGAAGGANIPFTVPAGAATTFSFNSANHQLTVQSGTGSTPSPSPTPTTPPAGTGSTLGATYTPTGTTFRIWSPDNSTVTVNVAGKSYQLSPATLTGYSSVYQTVVAGDLKNQPYQFSVGGNAVRDPYAQMVNPGTTQGIVIDSGAVAPTGGSWATRPARTNREDSVVYELNVRDFTIDASSGVAPAKRGKFLGLVQGGTTINGVKTGIDHLKELGVTDVQILPSFDFNSTVPNWGYDPLNYNVPEEQFSQYTAAEDRIREYKDMVNEFHKAGIRVIMDVVYNHTASKDVFGAITGKYYNATDLSGTGNSIDDGNPMVSRMIRDSLEHWVRDYNVDGFRFDLLGVNYATNVADWGSYLNTTYPDRQLQIYGEPWSGGVTDSAEAQKVRYASVPTLANAHVGVFNGAYRDAIKGGTQDTVMNYMNGAGSASSIALGMRGSPLTIKATSQLTDTWNPAFAYDPEQSVNYVSVHDDLNLWDKITYSGATGGAAGRAGQIDRFATGMILTSQGIAFLSEGDEFLRSKVVGGNYDTAKNSYNAGDNVNAIHWGDKTANAPTYKFHKDAIALRKSTPALRLTTWDAVKNQMSTQVNGSVVISAISSSASAPTSYDTVVVYNPTNSDYITTLAAGSWIKVLDTAGAVSTTGNTAGPLAVTVFKKN
ncbi:pullulanase [Streptomyces sp. So13.3]|uniref:pullulanase X25 domain-containing protein n=1 Tax=Streptomyces TaxID=1883 RepID=UPI00164D7A1F|nr:MULTISPECIES: alpha-amylase family glycosyl hydrolase [Streptomyces]MCZ4102579.1 alpha-amylase family glycosyl hydrolase [Streptomyces sp. H39-C1]QNA77545.1 pullulanase [Streptomyces sp. So13.3]